MCLQHKGAILPAIFVQRAYKDPVGSILHNLTDDEDNGGQTVLRDSVALRVRVSKWYIPKGTYSFNARKRQKSVLGSKMRSTRHSGESHEAGSMRAIMMRCSASF